MIAMITTFFGIGRLRPAPGTWASAVAVLLAVLAVESGAALLVPLGAVIATLVGFWAVPQALLTSADDDPSEIVIDEVAGQWLAMCFTVIPLWRHGVSILDAWPGFVVPFLLFRLFDIWKPWLVGRAMWGQLLFSLYGADEERMRKVLGLLLEHLKVERATLVGNSLGGYLAGGRLGLRFGRHLAGHKNPKPAAGDHAAGDARLFNGR